jgi:hypothetical protein
VQATGAVSESRQAKLVVSFRAPDNGQAFERYFQTALWPQLAALPGVLASERHDIFDVAGQRLAQPYLQIVLTFANRTALDQALHSEAGLRAGRTLADLPEGAVHVHVAEVSPLEASSNSPSSGLP